MNRLTERQADKQRQKNNDNYICMQRVIDTAGQTDKQVGGQTDSRTDKMTDIKTDTHTHMQ